MGKSHSRLEKTLGQSFPDEHFFGLENFGNNCYFNSVLQALYYCRPFRHGVLSYGSRGPSGKEENLLSVLAELYESIANSKRKTGVACPRHFFARLRRENEQFDSTMQQDAQEFLNYTLNTIGDILSKEQRRRRLTSAQGENGHSGAGPAEGEGANGAHAQGEAGRTWVHEIFEGVLTNETKCLGCETVTQRDESFLDLSVDIEQNSSITACLRHFSSTETLAHDSKYHCETCCTDQEAQKRMRVKRLPNVLALHLKRFKYFEKLQRFKKLSYRVVHPFELRIFNTADDAENPDRVYDLFAVVVHVGHEPSRGHYISMVKCHGVWLLFDDEDVQHVPEATMAEFFGMSDDQQAYSKTSESAYILFYQARDSTLETGAASSGTSHSKRGKKDKDKDKEGDRSRRGSDSGPGNGH